MEKRLEKIAKNTAHPEESKKERNLRSFEHMQQRQFMKDARVPAKLNGMIMQ